ncbi:MAG: type II toxin-antitoxin system HicB family antitoxin [Proteobacteria bacterium]|nr:type II toxin-antitoxin system HicB family antitoxin [Pseudomonadota bacterium]
MQSFTYPFRFHADRKDGGFVVTCRDLPEAITQGESIADAMNEAQDCLDEALHARLAGGMDVPAPSVARRGERLVSPPVGTALKLAVYLAMREANVSKSDLARRLDVDEKEIRRALDPRHATKSARLEEALHALGRRVELQVA